MGFHQQQRLGERRENNTGGEKSSFSWAEMEGRGRDPATEPASRPLPPPTAPIPETHDISVHPAMEQPFCPHYPLQAVAMSLSHHFLPTVAPQAAATGAVPGLGTSPASARAQPRRWEQNLGFLRARLHWGPSSRHAKPAVTGEHVCRWASAGKRAASCTPPALPRHRRRKRAGGGWGEFGRGVLHTGSLLRASCPWSFALNKFRAESEAGLPLSVYGCVCPRVAASNSSGNGF